METRNYSSVTRSRKRQLTDRRWPTLIRLEDAPPRMQYEGPEWHFHARVGLDTFEGTRLPPGWVG